MGICITLFSSVQTVYTLNFVKNKNIPHFRAGFSVGLIPKLPLARTQQNTTTSTPLGWYIRTYVGMDEERQPWCEVMLMNLQASLFP
jgi:hypothetical protein